MTAKGKNLILDDLAAGLQLSKSTISRAISGKGRVSEATRRRVLACVKAQGYAPNGIASSLARSRTNNICVAIPAEAFYNEIPFFDLRAGRRRGRGRREVHLRDFRRRDLHAGIYTRRPGEPGAARYCGNSLRGRRRRRGRVG